MKKSIYWIIGIVIVLIVIGLVMVLRIGNGGEDSWIKDSKGVYIKHGNPRDTPDYVEEQQDAIACANKLYVQYTGTHSIMPYSECLGTCKDYSIDVVNIPRNSDDDKVENQCSDFRNGITTKFIELDSDGEVVRAYG